MYVAVKGGENAINASHKLLATKRRGDSSVAELTVEQIQQQMPLAVDRIMNEGGIYDRELAALALKQASGDMIEAIFLLRAFRTTLPRFGSALAVDTEQMQIERRVSATFKDLPGGQILGPTYDYTHRLLDFSLLAGCPEHAEKIQQQSEEAEADPSTPDSLQCANAFDWIAKAGLLVEEVDSGAEPFDLTESPLEFPASRSTRLQNLIRGDEGFLIGISYSVIRGYGDSHPFCGEMRTGRCEISFVPEELGFEVCIGEMQLTECQMINGYSPSQKEPKFTRGYGLTFGRAETKALAVALVDRALQAKDYGEEVSSPAQNEEFILYHSDIIDAVGFVSHFRLPHYVDFQSELHMLRQMHAKQTLNKEHQS
ncbi:carbon-phosphorus lyase complex subunit PhnI [Vibrio nereis]|uniref:carbon-phosphorus lyase complex subunit PhnI n=1 Tax=Vibrio nereis TaxID=693 RepID=UPI00249534D3|nr:carbon-phosphorus lyase complex subunit PhnI [Vibrio nereis]